MITRPTGRSTEHVVIILRDPRDAVVGSCMSEKMDMKECAVRRIQSAAKWASWQFRHGGGTDPTKSLVLFYEDLIQHPKSILQTLQSFMQVRLPKEAERKSLERLKKEAQRAEAQTCQVRTALPGWMASHVSYVAQETLADELWRRWAAICDPPKWTPDVCPGESQLEVHYNVTDPKLKPRHHGDVCRHTRSENFMCPNLCRKVNAHPYCVWESGGEDVFCRADDYSQRMQVSFTVNPSTPYVIHTFYEPAFDARTEKLNRLTLASWEYHWQRAGWRTRVLTVKDAKRSPHFEDVMKTLDEVLHSDHAAYERMCFLRHLAMAEAGGGWMSDYDTLPTQLLATDRWLEGGRFSVLQGGIPALISASQEEWLRIGLQLPEIAKSMVGGRSQFPISDMGALMELQARSPKAYLSLNLVGDATNFLARKLPCRDFHSFYLAIHFSHQSIGSRYPGWKNSAIEEHRPSKMNETMNTWWECLQNE